MKVGQIINLFLMIWVVCLAKSFGAIPVNVISIKKGSMQQEESFAGQVLFKEIANIASQSNGIIQEVHFRIGQHVKKGQKLLTLNDEMLQKDIIIKQSKLNQALYILEKHQKELQRYRNLLDTQSISLQQYENIEYEIKSQEALILALQAELDISVIDLGNKVIYAPFDGIVIDQKVHQGEWVSIGEVVAQILNTKDVEVMAYIPSFMMNHLSLNQKAQVQINNRNYNARIIALIPKADTNSRNFPIYLSIQGDSKILDGMPASIKLEVSKKNTGFLIPRDCIIRRNGKDVVFVVRENKAYILEVEIISTNRGNSLIKGDFQEGENIVLRGQDRLKEGMEVKIIS